jgi:hypothetical protein
MSQHVSETCNESNGLWLPLTEYAVKSGVSLSTIRRKIKSNSIPYRLEKGRYLILFDDRKILESRTTPVRNTNEVSTSRTADFDDERAAFPLVEKAVRLVSQGFEHALREKDERIRLLEKRNLELDEQLNELRTLVRVLEEKYEVRY